MNPIATKKTGIERSGCLVAWGHFERMQALQEGAICIIRAVASSRVQLASVTRPLGAKLS